MTETVPSNQTQITAATVTNCWIATAEGNVIEQFQQVHNILQQNRFCTLATCSTDGLPWASPLLYGYDSQLTIYWSSAIVSRHSDYITQNHGRSAITIYDSTAQPGKIAGLFLSGQTRIVPDDQTAMAMEYLFARVKTRPDRTAADYCNDSPRRFYQFEPSEIWITGERVPHGKQLIDTKIQLDRKPLIAYLTKLSAATA
ncbi:pyridoxamine 5'-phosphate oxidase family protein [filamentous cyanobacterium LEGE 11480]|uniref:Pyridoxamine 5'-phosphate oxidase family protein n=1 Tax=Romeriopsis navalis LEGE 11480 TaxID=2777977 RepID=A0A928Z5I4_9CYAN|nr:pyridoxamine 5'-phosphate oxidase family protein [Romeriopsis navalis]MBE9032854.1 pyridoxamine 5'-phosphate oxidase family protein [Romeriopsis navalis LEGE 11480]